MSKSAADSTDPTVVYFGNRNTIQLVEHPDHPGDMAKASRQPVKTAPKKNITMYVIPAGVPLLTAADEITKPTGFWQAHSDDPAPAWVAADGPLAPMLAQVLADHYGGIEVRDADHDLASAAFGYQTRPTTDEE